MEARSQCYRATSLLRFQRGSFLPVPASEDSNLPWLVVSSPRSLPPLSHGPLLCLSSECLLWGHLSLDLVPTEVIQNDLILRCLIISTKIPFPNKVPFTDSGDWDLDIPNLLLWFLFIYSRHGQTVFPKWFCQPHLSLWAIQQSGAFWGSLSGHVSSRGPAVWYRVMREGQMTEWCPLQRIRNEKHDRSPRAGIQKYSWKQSFVGVMK